MRWFKHMTNASRDQSLLELRDEFGMEGYGAYWIILETIGEKLATKDKDQSGITEPSLRLSSKNWRKFVTFSPKKFQKFVTFSQKLGLFFAEFDGEFITINCPKLLKYRDEWTKKKGKKKLKNSGVTPDKLRRIELDTELELDNTSNLCTRSSNYISAEPEAHAQAENIFLEIPLQKYEMHAVTKSDIETWQRSHPTVDVESELLKIRDWNAANSKKRKTRKGIVRHIQAWLSRAGPSSMSRSERNAQACQSFISEAKRGKNEG